MSTINSDLVTERQKKISQALAKANLDALVLNPSPSLVYFTGLHFHLSERPVVLFMPASGTPALVLPELEAQKLHNLPYPLESFTYGEDPSQWPAVFKQAAQAAGLSAARIGVEERALRFLELAFLKEAQPESTFVSAGEVIAELRMYKDEDEIAAMQEAVDTAQSALEATLPLIKIGMTEKELAAELVMQLFRAGSGSSLPFQPIVSGGPNGANPHAVPTDRPLAAGDLLVIDFGATVSGYYSDITRTFAVGEPNEEQLKIHQTVQAANQAARQTAKPGVTCNQVDQAARQVIEEAGFGQYFTHRTGHGLGLDIHEEPYIRGDNPIVLEPGMTFTIEPGIYIPQQDGVRIEDNVVITADGLRSLTTLRREIRIVG
ncbi:M24 family metallopeptidase [Chloroflexota bacterium]